MSVLHTVERGSQFDGDLAPLRRKYKRLDDDLTAFLNGDLCLRPRVRMVGRTPIPGVPGVWKTRMGIPSANIGASGGLRLVYLAGSETAPVIVLLRAYHKADIKDLPRKVIAHAKVSARALMEARGYPPELIAKLFS